jgi:hypothetical protein
MQSTFFNPEYKNCAENCTIFTECGGGLSAPCGCVVTEHGKKYDCGNCSRICMERRAPKDIHALLEEGLKLENLSLSTDLSFSFPQFIPLGTRNANSTLSLPWVGVEFTELIGKGKLPKPKPYLLKEPAHVFDHLKVSTKTNLIAVLNANDVFLEAFWGMPHRQRFFATLRDAGFSIVTGPTFSVINENVGYLPPHNIVMQYRHNKIVDEIQESGLMPAPNVYWRGEHDIESWIKWLNHNRPLIISRDFSMTKTRTGFSSELKGFMDLLNGLDYQPHVFLVGTGLKNGVNALEKLRKSGLTSSIFTQDPALAAARAGMEYIIGPTGELQKRQNRNFSKRALVKMNIQTALTYLEKV